MILKLETRPPSVVCEQVEPGPLSESPTTRRAKNLVVKGRYKYKLRGTKRTIAKVVFGQQVPGGVGEMRTNRHDSGTWFREDEDGGGEGGEGGKVASIVRTGKLVAGNWWLVTGNW